MFEIGQIVMHPISGICKIECIETKSITRTEKRDFFVLKPIYSDTNTTIFLPINVNKVGVREPITAKKANEIINSVDISENIWIDNSVQREEAFYKILKSGEHKKIIQLIAELRKQEKERNDNGKQLRISDSKILKSAEKIINEEFAYSLNLELEEVYAFIMNKIGIEVPVENE